MIRFRPNYMLMIRRWTRPKQNFRNLHFQGRDLDLQINDSKELCVIDLRSDTVTKPCNNMRNNMKNSIVGDDVKEEDETVIVLEKKMAEMTGKEAGLFVASGTMGNLISVLTHCSRRGAEVILGDKSHIFKSEQANIVQFGGVQPYIIPTNDDATFDLHVLESSVRDNNFHYPHTELICLENTHGRLGGKIPPQSWVDDVTSFAEEKKLFVHMDGARIFNASIASGIPVPRLLQGIHSVSICLSKGLGAPIGSVIVGSHSCIERARRIRKGLGGGWRQAGIVAAAGIYALNNNIDRLAKDHANARLIAKGIDDLKNNNFGLNLSDVQTNIILLQINPKLISVQKFCQRLEQVTEEDEKALGRAVSVLGHPYTATCVRFLTHLGVNEDAARAALSKIAFVIERISQDERR